MFPLRATLFCRPLRLSSGLPAGCRRLAPSTTKRSAPRDHLGLLLLVALPTPLSWFPFSARRSRGFPRFLSSLSQRAMLSDPGKSNPLLPLACGDSFWIPAECHCFHLRLNSVSRLNCFRKRATVSLRPGWVPCLRLNLIIVRFVVPFRFATLGSFPPHKLQDSVSGGWLSLSSASSLKQLPVCSFMVS